MSSRAEKRDSRPSSATEKRREGAIRLKRATENYSRFVAVTPLGEKDQSAKRVKEMKAAQDELQAAKDNYAAILREDPDFKRRSDEAERRLAEGPPWDDVITPAHLREMRSKDR